MNEKAKSLLNQFFSAIRGEQEIPPTGPPTHITRRNLNDTRNAVSMLVSACTLETELVSDESLHLADEFYNGLIDAEVKMGTPGTPMSWDDVRAVYGMYFAKTAEALAPEARAKRLADLKAKQAANVATPVANAEKIATEVPTLQDLQNVVTPAAVAAMAG